MKKSELSRLKLIAGLQEVLATSGIQGTTFQSVADRCGVSQALVVKTFKTRENLIWSAFVAMIDDARRLTDEAVTKADNPDSGLRLYVNISIKIFTRTRSTGKLYLLLYYLSSFDKKYLDFNSSIKQVAVERIVAIIKPGFESNIFSSSLGTRELAKIFHNSLTGLLINHVTENNPSDLHSAAEALCSLFLDSLLSRRSSS